MLTIYAYGVYKIYHFKRSLMQTMQVQCIVKLKACNKQAYLTPLFCRMLLFNSKAVLSQWKPRDAAVNCKLIRVEINSGISRSSLQ